MIKYKVKKTVSFSAGHYLTGLSDDHPCSRQHGHDYKVTIELWATRLDADGFVVDFTEISRILKNAYDHRNLNDVMPDNPTAEALAVDIMVRINDLLSDKKLDDTVFIRRIGVQETESGYAEIEL